jgi:hypothetical protein
VEVLEVLQPLSSLVGMVEALGTAIRKWPTEHAAFVPRLVELAQQVSIYTTQSQ